MIFAQQPEGAFALLVIDFLGEFLFQPLEFLFAQIVKIIAILLGDMKAINDQSSSDLCVRRNEVFDGSEIAFPHIRGEMRNRAAQGGGNLFKKGAYRRFFRSGKTANTRTLPFAGLTVTMAA